MFLQIAARRGAIACAGFGLLATIAGPALGQGGRIVVANDDWTLSNVAYILGSDSGPYVENVCSFFTGGTSGSFLVYSDNFGLTESLVASTVTAAGHSWTVQSTGSITLAQMQTYDAVFLGGVNLVPSTADLVSYVQGGGGVYLFGGGAAPSTIEPATWNPFLNVFGLGFATVYNFTTGNIPITNTSHPLFSGVGNLYQNGGHDIFDLNALDPQNEVIETFNGHGLYATYVGVPTPSAGALLGLGVLVAARRRRP